MRRSSFASATAAAEAPVSTPDTATLVVYVTAQEQDLMGPLAAFGLELLESPAVKPHLPGELRSAAQRELAVLAAAFVCGVDPAELRGEVVDMIRVKGTTPPKTRIVRNAARPLVGPRGQLLVRKMGGD